MTCMSAAYSSYLYFSKEGGVNESYETFQADNANLQQHIIKMFDWDKFGKRLKLGRIL